MKKVERYLVAKWYGLDIVQAVVETCLTQAFLDDLEAWMRSHAAVFTDDEEHKLEYTALHNEFTGRVDARIESVVKRHGKTVAQFYDLCRNAEALGDEGNAVSVFVTLLLAAADYLTFVDVMRSADRRAYFFQIMRGWRQQFAADVAAASAAPPAATT